MKNLKKSMLITDVICALGFPTPENPAPHISVKLLLISNTCKAYSTVTATCIKLK